MVPIPAAGVPGGGFDLEDERKAMVLLLIPGTRGFLFAGEQERRNITATALSSASERVFCSRFTFHASHHRRE
jgi:hypothetical protein